MSAFPRILPLCLLLAACAAQPPAAPDEGLRLIALNDFHGYLDPPADPLKLPQGPALRAGGAAWLAGAIATLKQNHPRNVVVAGGDLVGASPLNSGLFHDEPAIEALGRMGLELSSVGNHEFDQGRAELLRKQNGGCYPGGTRGRDTCVDGDFAGARYHYLAANVVDRASGNSLFPPYEIKAYDDGRGGKLAVAFVGLVLKQTPTMVSPAGIAGLDFADEADTANALLPRMRALGATAFVILIHQGGSIEGSYNDQSCPGLRGDILPLLDRLDPAYRVVVSAHTHRAYVCNVNGRLLTSAGSYGRFITAIDLRFDAQGAIADARADNYAVIDGPQDGAPVPAFPADPGIAALVARYDALAAPLTSRNVGRIAADLTREPLSPAGQSALGGVVADSELEATRGQGAVAAFINSGGVRADLIAARSGAGEKPGEVSYGEAYQVLPFGDRLVTLSLSGEQIYALLNQQWSRTGQLRMLQVSAGVHYQWDDRRAVDAGKVVPGSLRIAGEAVRPERRYRITVVDFLANGGDGFTALKEGADRVESALDMEAFTAYLDHHAPLAAPAPDRVQRLDR